MKKLLGYTILCVAAGMLLMIIIDNIWIGLIFIAFLIIIGYNLLQCR